MLEASSPFRVFQFFFDETFVHENFIQRNYMYVVFPTKKNERNYMYANNTDEYIFIEIKIRLS